MCWKHVWRTAGPHTVFFRNKRPDADPFETASRQPGFEAGIKHRDGDQLLVVLHGRSIG